MHATRWTARAFATLLGAAVTLSGCATADPAPPDRNAQLVREAFARGVGEPDTFYAILAEDVRWTVARADRPTTYTSRREFLDGGARPVVDRLTGQIQADVHEILVDDDRLVARWRGTATARDGRPYVNEYAWVMTMEDERVTDVVAYLDMQALDELLTRVN
ncbi:nuclear transport factor 2 family protein [Mycolicibacterium litorale]|uniref:nuclear transport factor 2 family protein n=1 Tax=Mycolicibacterium litorale TaxID=758802 RepID=UPI003CF00CB1